MACKNIKIIRSFSSPAIKPGAIAYGDGVLWHVDRMSNKILLLDPITGMQLKSFDFIGNATGLSFAYHQLWIADQSLQIVYVYDPYQKNITQHIKLLSDGTESSLSCDGNLLWQLNAAEGKIYGIDLQSMQLSRVIELDTYMNSFLCWQESIYLSELGKSVLRQRSLSTMALEADFQLPNPVQSLTGYKNNFWFVDDQSQQICQFHLS